MVTSLLWTTIYKFYKTNHKKFARHDPEREFAKEISRTTICKNDQERPFGFLEKKMNLNVNLKILQEMIRKDILQKERLWKQFLNFAKTLSRLTICKEDDLVWQFASFAKRYPGWQFAKFVKKMIWNKILQIANILLLQQYPLENRTVPLWSKPGLANIEM